MKITINAKPKEIADLALELRNRLWATSPTVELDGEQVSEAVERYRQRYIKEESK